MNSVKLLSPAKVNLFLRIIGPRGDGYHLLQSVVQPVSLFDEVSVSVEEGDGVELRASGRAVPPGGENLAAKAAVAYAEAAAFRGKVRVEIKKRIPVGAGLGGGSGNAAAVLVGLERLLGGLGETRLLRTAASLGSDVPFFVGSTASLVEGAGERVRPLADFPLFHYVILFPGINVSTADVYSAWKSPELSPEEADPAEIAGRFRRGELALENGLEETVFGLFPEVASFKEIFRSFGAAAVLVSGSGSSVFSVFREEAAADGIYEYLKTSRDFEVFRARGISGWHFLAD